MIDPSRFFFPRYQEPEPELLTASERISQVEQAIRAGVTLGAIDGLLQAARSEPQRLDLSVRASKLLALVGAETEARDLLTAVLAKDPEYGAAHAMLGLMMLATAPEAALASLLKATATDLNDDLSPSLAASLLSVAGRHAEAANLYDEALRRGRVDAVTVTQHVVALIHASRLADAERAAAAAARRHRHSRMVWEARAIVAEGRGEHRTAVAFFERADSMDADNVAGAVVPWREVLVARAAALRGINAPERALTAVNRALEWNPSDPTLTGLRDQLLVEAGLDHAPILSPQPQDRQTTVARAMVDHVDM